jgi:hypothetical protein
MIIRACVALFLFTFAADLTVAQPLRHSLKTKNIILITTDGFRSEELFTGADPALLNKESGGVADTNALKKEFWSESPQHRREILMPFFWRTIAKKGQVFGNQQLGSIAQITNGRKFSYPGYNEILTGAPDPRIDSNAKKPNENVTVLEWLHSKPAFRGQVAAFSAWDVMPFIINRDRCGFPVMGGWEPVPDKKTNEREKLLNELISEMTRQNDAEVDDSLLFHAAQEYLLKHKPRVLMVSFLETDHWGHAGRYDHLLKSAQRVDRYIEKLWTTVQSMPKYKDKTTFIITTDHGRGPAPVQWKNHGEKVERAENIWMAFMGPDTPALGERQNASRVTQSQIAATLAALLGEDLSTFSPTAAKPIGDVLSPR